MSVNSTMTPTLSLSFDGQCEAAFRFYEKCLGAKLAFVLTWGESPMAKDAPPEWAGKVCHATLNIGETSFAGADAFPGTYEAPRGFAVMLSPSDAAEADRIFNVLADGGKATIPLQETFWAARFGAVTDRFGIPWAINCEKPA